MDVKNIALIAVLSALLFALQMAFSFLPNIQLTFLLIFVFSKCLSKKSIYIILLIHVFLINMIYGTWYLIPVMYLGYIFTPIMLQFVFKNVDNSLKLGFISIICSIFYVLIFAIYTILFIKVNLKEYLIMDIPYTLILCACSFLTIVWLYNPLSKGLKDILERMNYGKI